MRDGKENRKEAVDALDSIVDGVIRKLEDLREMDRISYYSGQQTANNRRVIERHIKPVVYDYLSDMLIEIFNSEVIITGLAHKVIEDRNNEYK